MKTNALIIFTRNPELGKVKTRLAKTIGDKKALEVYKDLLLYTKSVTLQADCDKFVYYDNTIYVDDIWSETIFEKKVQSGADFGQRMQNAFQDVLDLGYKNCLIIGSDLFDLETEHINDAFLKLNFNDVVIGPAEDGGYYLLGLKKMIPEIFSNKNWGTETVLADALKDLSSVEVAFLEELNDIDTIEDLEKSNYYDIKN